MRTSFPRLSLMDLYVLFPEYLQQFSFHGMAERRVELRALELRKVKEAYESLPDIRTVYRELETYQKVSFARLVAKGILSKTAFDAGDAELVKERLPEPLRKELGGAIDRHRGQIRFMEEAFSGMRVDGTDGMFRRAGIDVPGRFR